MDKKTVEACVRETGKVDHQKSDLSFLRCHKTFSKTDIILYLTLKQNWAWVKKNRRSLNESRSKKDAVFPTSPSDWSSIVYVFVIWNRRDKCISLLTSFCISLPRILNMLFKYGLKELHDICLVGKPGSDAMSTLPIVC